MEMRKLLAFVLLLMLCICASFGAQAAENVVLMGQTLGENSHWTYDSASRTLTAASMENAQVSYQSGVLTLRDLTIQTNQTLAELMTVLQSSGALTVELIGSSRIERTVFAPVIVCGDLTFTGTGSLTVKGTGFSAVKCGDLTMRSGNLHAETTGLPPYGAPNAVVSASGALAVEGGALYVHGHAPHVAAVECAQGAKLTGGLLRIVSDHADGIGVTAGNMGGANPHEETIELGPDARVEVRAGSTAILLGKLRETGTGRSWKLDKNANVFVYPAANAPATGDGAQPLLWSLMAMTALMGAVVLRRKQRV